MRKKEKQELLSVLNQFGYPLLHPKGQTDPNTLLAKLTLSEDPRLLEGFPVVMAHLLLERDARLDLQKTEKLVSKPESRNLFRQLVSFSLYLLGRYHLISHHFLKEYASWAKKDQLQGALRHQTPVRFGRVELDPERMQKTFLNYVVHEHHQQRQKALEEKSKMQEEFRREYYLSLLFPVKQKELLYKKLRGEALTKTEREYYSHVVKKKLLLLADPDLHRFAQKVLHG